MIKEQFKSKRLQYIGVEENGMVISTDNVFFSISKGTLIQDFHPVFESVIHSIQNSQSKYIRMDAVHMEDKICDIETMQGGPDGMVIIVTDMTDHYNNMYPIVQKRNESVIYSQIVEVQNKMLKEQEIFKDRFIASFSHEIRNPLTAIATFSSMLSKTELDYEQSDLAKAIVDQSNSLKVLLDDILDLSVIQSGLVKIKKEKFDFHNMVNQIGMLYKDKGINQSIGFTIGLDPKIPKVLIGDSVRTQQLLNNLILNSFRNTSDGNISVTIDLLNKHAQQSLVRFTIKDSGNGIPDSIKDKVFDNYVSESISGKMSSGLGLAIVKGLTDSMNGRIELTDTSPEGTTFTLDLKFQMPINKTHAVNVQPKTVDILDKKIPRKLHTLLIERNDISKMTTMKILVRTGNFSTYIASNASEAIQMARKYEFDLIIASNQLDNMEAPELLTEIRSISSIKNQAPALIVTGNHTVEKKTFKGLKVKNILYKPHTEEELLESIYSMIDLDKLKKRNN